jgi:predicted permease
MRRLLRSWLWRVPLTREVDEELALHLEMRTREFIERGMDPAAARELALQRLGDVARLKRTMTTLGRRRDRDMRLAQWLGELREDLRFAIRQLKGSPAFTLVATLTLALGIGANSAIFALVDATLLRPLPYGNPDRLVSIWEKTATINRGYGSPLNMLDWNARSRTFEAVAGFTPSVGGMVMAGADGNAETVSRQWVTAGIFDVLGVRTVAGRTFSREDDAKRANVIVMSEAFWRSRFNADPTLVGRELRLDGSLWTVVGIVPKDFQLMGQSSIWAMRPVLNLPPRARAAYAFHVVGRLKPGVSIEAATADLGAVAEGLAQEFPQTNKGRGVALERLHDSIVGRDLRLTSKLFLGVVGFVLLICCANVANLLFARATMRTRELAVRSALGAGRGRIVRQLLTESLLLSVMGGVLGAGIGAAILSVAPTLIPEGLLPATVSLTFDGRVVAFCAAAALGVGLLFGMMPAWKATAFSTTEVMGSDTRTTTGSGGQLRRLLVIGEVATAVFLLCGAGLLLRTLLAVEAFDRGYRAERVLSMLVDPLGSKYPTDESLQQFFDQVEAEVGASPGVAGVAWASDRPLDFFETDGVSFEVVGAPPLEARDRPTTAYQVVSPSYFSTLDLPIVDGRPFDRGDRRNAVPVCIVNEALARTFGRSPVGQRIALRPTSSPDDKPVIREIVGVARQVKKRPDETEALVQIYQPMTQGGLDDIFLLVRPASGRAAALAPAVRAAIGRIDTAQLVSVGPPTTLDDVAHEATAAHRFRATLVVAFAALALALAMVGVFGILAYSVQQRTRDIAVRRAMGATTADVVRMVARSAAGVIGAGAIIGLLLAAAMTRLLTSVLVGVAPVDPATFVLVAGTLLVTAAVAVAGPAWRAARVDPAQVLRGR